MGQTLLESRSCTGVLCFELEVPTVGKKRLSFFYSLGFEVVLF